MPAFINKMFYSLLVAIVFSLSCNGQTQKEFKYSCADRVSETELNGIPQKAFKGYTDTDLENLAEITTQVIDLNGDTTEFEVFYHQKTDTSLILDFYGFTTEKQIDNTVCALFKNNKCDFKKHPVLLFYKSTKGSDAYYLFVALTRKKG
jgi:hypothetical protein